MIDVGRPLRHVAAIAAVQVRVGDWMSTPIGSGGPMDSALDRTCGQEDCENDECVELADRLLLAGVYAYVTASRERLAWWEAHLERECSRSYDAETDQFFCKCVTDGEDRKSVV